MSGSLAIIFMNMMKQGLLQFYLDLLNQQSVTPTRTPISVEDTCFIHIFVNNVKVKREQSLQDSHKYVILLDPIMKEE